MSQNIAVEQLLIKRQQLLKEKEKMVSQFNGQIMEIDSAIEIISGKKVWQIATETLYDDENPQYIKASEEEI